MSFDLDNVTLWESIFINPKAVVEKNSQEPGQDGPASNEDADMLQGDRADGQLEKAREKEYPRNFDAPPTWVGPLSLDRPRYLMRYPPLGQRTTYYYASKVEQFARYANAQCMVMKLTLYLDEACTIVKEIHETFDGRKDKLYKRSRYFLGRQYFVEHYHPGSYDEVKQWKEYPGKSIEIDFHVEGRLDRLVRREEIVGQSFTEYFCGRTDHMVSRTINITCNKPEELMGSRLALLGFGLTAELYITMMTLQYERDPRVTPGEDIFKRIFYVKEGKMVTMYHFAKDKVTGRVTTHIHTRLPGSAAPSEMALSQEEGLDDALEALQFATMLERECHVSVKTSHQNMKNLHDYRTHFEYHVDCEKHIFDAALDSALDCPSFGKVGAQRAADKAAKGAASGSSNTDTKAGVSVNLDYLSPFLRNVKDPNNITREEALEIRQNCMDGLKARLVERANIIQNRLNDENAKLGRRQEQFQRSQRDGDLSTEDYEKYCTEAMFRIQILEQRLAQHEEAALKKYADLDAKLLADPRLKVLRQ